MNDTTKLPKWAQHHIENLEYRLERDVAYWRDKITQAEAGDTDTFIGDHPEDIGLPRGSRIVFCLPDLSQIEARVKDDYLYVYGSESLAVQPQAGNVIKVRAGRWW